MPKKDGTPTVAELRIIDRVKRFGGVVVLTKGENGDRYTTPHGLTVASDDATVARMIRDGMFAPAADDGLFPGMPQTFVPAL